MKKIISKNELRDFGLLIGLAFPTLIGWLIPLITGHTFKSLGTRYFFLFLITLNF